jgi:prepilin-type N-terminal cleavage/methylation domain-containing protein
MKLSKGFTLIELIVVMAVFLFIIGAAITIFISIVQNQKRILAEQELLNQISYAEEYMTKALRMATVDTTGACLGQGYTNYNYRLTNRQVGSFYTGIKFLNQSNIVSGYPLCQEFYLDTTTGVLEEVKTPYPYIVQGSPIALTSQKLTVSSIRFGIDGTAGCYGNCPDGDQSTIGGTNFSSFQPRITIVMRVKVAGLGQYPTNTLETTVSQRNISAQGLTYSESPGWQYRKAIVISHTNVGSTTDLLNFPLLVKINADTDIGGNIGDTNTGRDIRFTSSDGTTLLPYERENFNVSGGAATGNFWVKVPVISHTSPDTTIYIYYGNPSAADGQDVPDVWDSHFKGVWHLEETGSNPTVYDSTLNHNNSIAQLWTPTAVNGKIGGAASFDGSSNYITTPITVSGSPALTISLWANLYAGPYSEIHGYGYPQIANSAGCSGINFYANNNTSKINIFLDQTGNPTWIFMHTGNTYPMGTDSLHYISATFDGTNPKMYVDSTDRTGTPLAGTANMTSGSLIFGNNACGNSYWKGIMDEIRLSDMARPNAWVKFEYCNMAIDTTNCDTGAHPREISFGSPEPGPF